MLLPLHRLQRLVLRHIDLPLCDSSAAFLAQVQEAAQQLGRPRAVAWDTSDELVPAPMLTLLPYISSKAQKAADAHALLAARLACLAPLSTLVGTGLRLDIDTWSIDVEYLCHDVLRALSTSFGPTLTQLSLGTVVPLSNRCYRELHTLMPALRVLHMESIHLNQIRLLAQHHPGPLTLLVSRFGESEAALALQELAAAGAQPHIKIRDLQGWPLPPYRPDAAPAGEEQQGKEEPAEAPGAALELPGSGYDGAAGLYSLGDEGMSDNSESGDDDWQAWQGCTADVCHR